MRRESDESLGLDAIEAALNDDPHALDALAPAACVALLTRAEVLAARLRVRVLAASINGNGAAPTSPPAERLLRVREAAAQMAMTVDYVHRNWQKLGGFKDDDGHVKFSAAVVQRHIQQRRSR